MNGEDQLATGEDRRFVGGLVVWGIVVVVVAIPELTAAFSHNTDHLWRTISKTTGHLEARWWWVDLVVVSIIAIVALHAVVNPIPSASQADPGSRGRGLRRTPGGRVTLVKRQEPLVGPHQVTWAFTLVYLVCAAAIVVGASLWVWSRPRSGYGLEVTMYLLIALLFIIVPSIAAAGRLWVTPFTSFFATLIRIQRVNVLIGCVLIAGLAVLLIHLSLYPWPTRCYIGGPKDKQALAAATTPQQALNIVKPGNLPDACFRP